MPSPFFIVMAVFKYKIYFVCKNGKTKRTLIYAPGDEELRILLKHFKKVYPNNKVEYSVLLF